MTAPWAICAFLFNYVEVWKRQELVKKHLHSGRENVLLPYDWATKSTGQKWSRNANISPMTPHLQHIFCVSKRKIFSIMRRIMRQFRVFIESSIIINCPLLSDNVLCHFHRTKVYNVLLCLSLYKLMFESSLLFICWYIGEKLDREWEFKVTIQLVVFHDKTRVFQYSHPWAKHSGLL